MSISHVAIGSGMTTIACHGTSLRGYGGGVVSLTWHYVPCPEGGRYWVSMGPHLILHTIYDSVGIR